MLFLIIILCMVTLTNEEIQKIKNKLESFDDIKEKRKFLLKAMHMEKFIANRKTQKVGNVPIHIEAYESKPDDPVIIFIPGIGTYAEMYCEFFQKLSSWGFNVMGVDLRGHGYSGGKRGYYTVEQVQQDLSDVISHCINKYNEKIVLFGCSIGSPLAMAAAENDSRVKALICHTLFLSEHPLDFVTMIGWNSLNVTKLFFPDLKIDFRTFIDIDELVKDNVFGEFMDYDDLLVWEYPVKTLSSVYSRKTKLLNENMDFKSVIMIGERDELIKISYEKKIIKAMEHNFDLIVIPGGKHMLPFDHVRETVYAVRDWVNKVFKRANK